MTEQRERTSTSLDIVGADPAALAALRSTGVDHGGNPVVPFTDPDGGWPLRCCLTDSLPGDELAVVAWSPFPWRGVFAEVGPIVVHADDCGGVQGSGVPPQFLGRRQVLRPYGFDQRLDYDRLVVVDADGSLPDVLAELVSHRDVAFVLSRNLLAGCYSFTARRSTASVPEGQPSSGRV